MLSRGVSRCSSLALTAAKRASAAPSVCARAGAASSLSLPSSSSSASAFFCSSAAARAAEEKDSHNDFAPKVKVSQDDPARLKAQVEGIVASHPVVLFMKGTPQQPMCGFSQRVVQLLKAEGADIYGVDILSNASLRTFLKSPESPSGGWPTFPQLYLGGEFVGGCDIATSLYQSGELQTMIKKAQEEKKGGSKKE